MRTHLLILIPALLLISCNNSSIDIEKIEEEVSSAKVISCDDFQSITTENGLLYNNVWNKRAAQNHPHSQCLTSKTFDGKEQQGWTWDWPEGKRVIYAYPQIKVGASPWQPSPSFNNTFPVKISSLASLSLSFELDILTNSNYNIASSMWVTKTRVLGAQPQPSSIAAEIMVLFDNFEAGL